MYCSGEDAEQISQLFYVSQPLESRGVNYRNKAGDIYQMTAWDKDSLSAGERH